MLGKIITWRVKDLQTRENNLNISIHVHTIKCSLLCFYSIIDKKKLNDCNIQSEI